MPHACVREGNVFSPIPFVFIVLPFQGRALLYQENFMADLFDNPMGLCGFEFVEFASPVAGVLEPLFEKMGFTLVA